MGGALQHDPEKWNPVFRKDHAPPKCRSAIAPLEAVALQSAIRKLRAPNLIRGDRRLAKRITPPDHAPT
jgi:hypothetical protein